MAERRRAVALAQHYRQSEGFSVTQIAERLGRSPATIKAYFYDPTGETARDVKARYVGVCRGCGAYTQPRNGKGDAYAYCKACHPGAVERRWTRERVLAAMTEWRSRYARLPTSYDWSRTHASRRGERRSSGSPKQSVACVERGHPAIRHLGCRSRRGFAAKRGGADTPAVGDVAIGQ